MGHRSCCLGSTRSTGKATGPAVREPDIRHAKPRERQGGTSLSHWLGAASGSSSGAGRSAVCATGTRALLPRCHTRGRPAALLRARRYQRGRITEQRPLLAELAAPRRVQQPLGERQRRGFSRRRSRTVWAGAHLPALIGGVQDEAYTTTDKVPEQESGTSQ